MEVKTFLTQLCEHCGLSEEEVEVSVEEKDDKVVVNINIPEEDSGIFIGHHGDSIDSIQRIMRIVFQDEFEDKRVVLNINDYREKREDRLKDLTYSVANKVLDTGEKHVFNSFLPAHERFIIHSTLSEEKEFDQLESVSEGIGRNRKLIIRLKNN